MKLGIFLFKIIIVTMIVFKFVTLIVIMIVIMLVTLIVILIIIIVIIVTIVITPARPHKHDQAGGHGPALFWPLKLRRFRVHILVVYYTTYQHTSSILYYLPTALVLEYILWYFGTFHC